MRLRPTLATALLKDWVAAWISCLRSPFRSFCAVAICDRLLPIAWRFDWTPSSVAVEMVVDLS